MANIHYLTKKKTDPNKPVVNRKVTIGVGDPKDDIGEALSGIPEADEALFEDDPAEPNIIQIPIADERFISSFFVGSGFDMDFIDGAAGLKE